jgi:hypothetical protein
LFFLRFSKWSDLHVQHRGATIIDRCKAALNGRIQIVWIGDVLAARAESGGYVGKAALLALSAGDEA